ncbi:MAG: hypothetical protein ACXV5D_10025 [Halobacteriota archaeon]
MCGDKSAYKGYKKRFRPLEREVFTDVDPGFAGMWEAAGGVIPEGESEVYVDGKWVTAYLAQTVALTAASGWSIVDFGESSIGTYFDALPGSIHRYESIPFGLGLSLKLTNMLAPATMERLNARMSRVQKLGLQEIEDAGGIQGYNQIAKRKRELFSANEILEEQAHKHYDKIIIKKPQQP